jgi:hypothetical protein
MSFDPISAAPTATRTFSRLVTAVLLVLTPQTGTNHIDAGGLVGATVKRSKWWSPQGSRPQLVEIHVTSMSEGPPIFPITPATTQHEAIIRDGVDMFTVAGLTLPALQIVFSDDDRACDGHLGLFESSQQPWRITICSDLDFVPVHELAHAWITSNIDEPTRRRYLQIRNKSSWNSPQLDWNERGVEDAAFVIQQNLMTNITGELDEEWNSRATAYEFLTGRTSPLREEMSRADTGLNRLCRSVTCPHAGPR